MSFFSLENVIFKYNLFVKKERFNYVIEEVINNIFGPSD